MSSKKILLVEDDASIAQLISLHLRNLNYEVVHADTFKEGLDKALAGAYLLILLDIMLPDGDGLDICRKVREQNAKVPIIMLTAKSEEIDKVMGLESGADDYITKPFSVLEFLARIKAIVRRSNYSVIEDNAEVYSFDNLHIDVPKRKVTIDGKVVDLTKKEFELLYLLSKNKGVSYSREKLLDQVWGYQFSGYEHTVNSHVNRLRAKIEETPSKPKFILTSWGVGYKFNDEL